MLFNNTYNNLFELRDLFNMVFDTSKYDSKNYNEPYCNIYDKEDSILVNIVLPGVNHEDINVELNDNTLTIKGNRKQTKLEGINYLRQEREYNDFSKAIQLKVAVDHNDISANYHDGILSVELKKAPEEKPKKISIN